MDPLASATVERSYRHHADALFEYTFVEVKRYKELMQINGYNL